MHLIYFGKFFKLKHLEKLFIVFARCLMNRAVYQKSYLKEDAVSSVLDPLSKPVLALALVAVALAACFGLLSIAAQCQ